jgi:hypothetical protein
MYPGCSNHIYSEQYGEQIQYFDKLQAKNLQNDPWVQKKDYKAEQKSKRRCGLHKHNWMRGMPSLDLLDPTSTLDSNFQIHLMQQ